MTGKKINSIEIALEMFVIFITENIDYSSEGIYKKANKAYNNLEKVIIYLLENDAIGALRSLYSNENLYAKYGAHLYLAHIDTKEAKDFFINIKNMDIKRFSFRAEMALMNWDELSSPTRYDELLKSRNKSKK